MSFQGKSLDCSDCGQEFTFTAGEQEFYASRGLQNEPRRCPECRRARKWERYASNGYRSTRRMFPVICAQCGKDTEVPFEPREDRPAYCSECYKTVKVAAYKNLLTSENTQARVYLVCVSLEQGLHNLKKGYQYEYLCRQLILRGN